MHVTDLMIEKTLLGLLESMSQSGVPLRGILMMAVADGIVADPNSGVTYFGEAYDLVESYVNSLINTGGVR